MSGGTKAMKTSHDFCPPDILTIPEVMKGTEAFLNGSHSQILHLYFWVTGWYAYVIMSYIHL